MDHQDFANRTIATRRRRASSPPILPPKARLQVAIPLPLFVLFLQRMFYWRIIDFPRDKQTASNRTSLRSRASPSKPSKNLRVEPISKPLYFLRPRSNHTPAFLSFFHHRQALPVDGTKHMRGGKPNLAAARLLRVLTCRREEKKAKLALHLAGRRIFSPHHPQSVVLEVPRPRPRRHPLEHLLSVPALLVRRHLHREDIPTPRSTKHQAPTNESQRAPLRNELRAMVDARTSPSPLPTNHACCAFHRDPSTKRWSSHASRYPRRNP